MFPVKNKEDTMATKRFITGHELNRLSMYLSGDFGTAAILPRRTDLNAGVFPFVVMFACVDGEGTQSCQSLDEAREVATAVVELGSVYAQSVSFRFRQSATVSK